MFLKVKWSDWKDQGKEYLFFPRGPQPIKEKAPKEGNRFMEWEDPIAGGKIWDTSQLLS